MMEQLPEGRFITSGYPAEESLFNIYTSSIHHRVKDTECCVK